jgi:hypothetical protein
VADSFLQHDQYAFQLKANPTMRRCEDRRRLGIYAEDRLTEWIQGKAGQNGFAVNAESLVVGAPMDEVFVRDGLQRTSDRDESRGIPACLSEGNRLSQGIWLRPVDAATDSLIDA